MSELKEKIKNFLSNLSDEQKLFGYIANKIDSFDKEKDSVYYSGPYWDDEEIIGIIESVLAGKWLSSGEKVRKFELEFSRKFNKKHSVMVNSGSSANLVMIAALKKYFQWQDGDEIIVSSVGFPTTLNPIIQNNLKPVFVDIKIDDLNWDIEEIRKKITPNTRALFSSPVLGNPYDFDAVLEICADHNLELVGDNCDSLGSKWREKYLTDYSISSSCSFYPAHHITTAEGGMVSSDNSEIITLARSIAWWGRDCYCVGQANLLPCGTCGKRFDKWIDCYDGIIDHKYFFTNIGYNLKPLDLQGAIGLAQLKKFEEIHRKRRLHKKKIQYILEKIPEIRIPDELPKSETSWFGVPVICSTRDTKHRLVNHLEKNRIQTRNYFAGNILMHPAYKNLDDFRKYKIANQVLDRIFFLGTSPSYTNKTIEYVDDVVSKYLKS